MKTMAYRELDKRIKSLGDYRLYHAMSYIYDPGEYVMVNLSDPSVGIWERELSPRFSLPEELSDWLDEMAEIFKL